MTYILDTAIALGPSYIGLTDLRAQLFDTTGSNVGFAVSTGFAEIGSGYYLWHYAAYPDGHRGGVKFYRAIDSSVILAITAINPQEAEYVDQKVSSVDVSDLLSEEVADSVTFRELLRLLLAEAGGRLTGAGTNTERIRNVGNTKDVVVATVDSRGNRSAVSLDLS